MNHPRPVAADRASFSSLGGDQSPNFGAKKQRRHVTSACGPCRKAKRRCDGNVPCSHCIEKGLEGQCIVQEDKDGRRGKKRMLEELHVKSDALESIVGFLRGSDMTSVQTLVDLIRNEAPVNEVVHHARETLQRGYLNDQPLGRRQVMSIASLVDKPPIQVPAQPWTNMTEDDEAVSHLMSVYFTWHAPNYPVVDQDLFVSHMQSQDLESNFCSPFLVNAMLAAACFYTDIPAAFAVPGDAFSRGVAFRDEAIRLWNLEDARPSLANVQGIPVLTASVAFSGKDRLNYSFLSQLSSLRLELVKQVKKRTKLGDPDVLNEDFRRAYSSALWGSFVSQVDVAIGWRQPFIIYQPTVKRPYSEAELSLTRLWSTYPKPSGELPVYFNAVVDERFNLFTIVKDLVPLLLSGTPYDSPLPGHVILDLDVKLAGLRKIEQRLNEWYDKLPASAALHTSQSTPAPPLLDFYMSYHVFHLTIQNVILYSEGVAERQKGEAREKVIDRCRQILDIFEWEKRTIGFSHFGCQFVHCGASTAYALIDYLSSMPETRVWFHTVSVALCSASQRWTMARGIVKAIWDTLRQQRLESYLSGPTVDILKLSGVEDWKAEEHRRFESCVYPNYHALFHRGREFADTGELLVEGTAMKLDEDDSGESAEDDQSSSHQ